MKENTTPETEPKNDGKYFYTIGEVADQLGVSASLIRYWEEEFDIIRPQKNKKGNRLFTQKDIEAISLIRHYVKERGMTLKGARKKIKENRLDADNNFRVVHSLKQIRTFLLEIKDHLEKNHSPQQLPE
jgi:DNA-binding transcriptional MerR regulator